MKLLGPSLPTLFLNEPQPEYGSTASVGLGVVYKRMKTIAIYSHIKARLPKPKKCRSGQPTNGGQLARFTFKADDTVNEYERFRVFYIEKLTLWHAESAQGLQRFDFFSMACAVIR